MHIGKWLFVKHESKIVKGIVIDIFSEDIDIKLEYDTMRHRFSDYRRLLQKKLNISQWIIYSPEARKEINLYKMKGQNANRSTPTS